MIAVIQVDGLNRPLLDSLLRAGELPALGELFARGSRIELDSPGVHFPAGAFQTLYTGLGQGDHGLFYPFQWLAAKQRTVPAAALGAPESIWDRLARSGARAVVLDPYESAPPSNPPGPMVSGWQFAERTVLPRWARPPGLWRRLTRRFGRPQDVTEVFGQKRPAELLGLRDRLVEANERIGAVAVELLTAERLDLAWIAISTAHIGGHQLLDAAELLDTGAEGDRRALSDALADVYRSLDDAVNRIVSALPPGHDLILLSVVGMEPNTSRADLLPGMLEAVLADRPLERSRGGGIWRLRSALPSGARGRAARLLPAGAALRLTARLETPRHDWSRTAAFAHPADNQGYVRLNLAGRERDGIVPPEEADELLDRITAGLRGFADPDGRAAVASVDRTADHYQGAALDRLPDLVVRWAPRPATGIDRVVSPRHGEVHRLGVGSGRSGNHPERDCWAVLVPGGSAEAGPDGGARLSDIAATALALAGAPAPSGAEPLLQR